MKKTITIDALVRKNIKTISPYSSARDEYTKTNEDVVFLDANESPFQTKVNRYPDPQQRSVKAKIATLKNTTVDRLFLGNGSDEVLDLLFRAFCEPNQDNIITLPPTYGMYNVLAQINAVENREVLLKKDFTLSFEKIIKAIDTNTKLIFICTPNNPTGTVFSEEAICKLLETFNGLLVVDEAYIDFATTESLLKYTAKYENLVIVQTFSKAYGLAGIRLGMCFANPKIISFLNKIKPPYNVNKLTQDYALKALENQSKIKSQIAEIKNNKSLLSKQLLQVNWIEKIYPSEANFLLMKVDNATLRYSQLIANGIVVRNRSNQPLCENTLRITVGTTAENKKLIATLKNL